MFIAIQSNSVCFDAKRQDNINELELDLELINWAIEYNQPKNKYLISKRNSRVIKLKRLYENRNTGAS